MHGRFGSGVRTVPGPAGESDSESRPAAGRPFEAPARRVALALSRLGATADGLSLASVVPAIACAVAAALGHFYLAAGLLLVAGLCDLLDGALARASGRSTEFGALLDSTVDRIADAAPLLGLIAYFADNRWAALCPALALLGGFMVSYVRARAEGLAIALPPLWMRRTERLVITGTALVLSDIKIPDVALGAPVTLGLVLLLAVLSFAAAGHALLAARRLLDNAAAARTVIRVDAPPALQRAQHQSRQP